MITVLAGGVGAARFLQGLVRVVSPDKITVIVNTGDDVEFFGLHVSPDIDTVTYTLAGLVDETRGWGVGGDTFHCLDSLKNLGYETWFNLGDRDLALHIHRTRLLREGLSLSQVTASFVSSFGLSFTILPMSDERVETRVNTDAGLLGFQEYMVKRGAKDRVTGIELAGVKEAHPTKGVIRAILEAQGIILAPSNPLISIGPILALKGVKEALKDSSAKVLAISPIVGGAALKGPADRMMEGLGMEVSAYQVAQLYSDFVDIFIMDNVDSGLKGRVESLGVQAILTDTIMKGLREKEALASLAIAALEIKCR